MQGVESSSPIDSETQLQKLGALFGGAGPNCHNTEGKQYLFINYL